MIRFFPFIDIIAVLVSYETYVFWILPFRLRNPGVNGDHATAIRRLRYILKLPSILGRRNKVAVLYLLGHRLVFAKRYDEAISVLQESVAIGRSPFQAQVHIRLADALDAVGRSEEAAEQRAKAHKAADTDKNHVQAALAKGNLLAHDHRYDEASAIYEQTLPLAMADELLPVRQKLRAKLAIWSQLAGRQERAAYWAEQVLSEACKPAIRQVAQRMAALAYLNLGRLDVAELYFRQMYDEAVRGNDKVTIGKALAGLAGVMEGLGRLDEALDLALKAERIAPSVDRTPQVQVFEVYMSMGRYADARDAILRGLEMPGLPIPDNEDRSRAASTLGIARSYAEETKFAMALPLIDQVSPLLPELKMQCYCRALRAWILAGLGNTVEALSTVEALDNDVANLVGSPASQRSDYIYMARTSLLLAEYARAESYAQSSLALRPMPGSMPQALFLLGEARRGLGKVVGAREAYQAAVDTAVETVWTSRARDVLADLDRRALLDFDRQ